MSDIKQEIETGVEIAPGATVNNDTLTIDASKFQPPSKPNRHQRRKEKAKQRAAGAETYHRIYTTKTGAERIIVLHPTKGFRNMSMQRAMEVL